ncbi:SusC/RagA family TonB-linked outer membrane protein [Seonamhaeicola maritimus]|nr:TonB-dependent receptor [Seonamhaeicola maritimus]
MNKLIKVNKSTYSYLLALLFVALCSAMSVQAQNLTVTGTVTGSEDGLPIPGVAIVIKGTNTGSVTDFDGNYSINAKVGDMLQFSYLGMENESVKVTGSKLNVAMDSSLEDLEEVVVIGYGTVKKKELTGAVAQVKSEDIEQFVTSDVSSALQGQIAGVNVVASSGEPGAAAQVQIRGVTSISGTNEPLYVIDGVPQIGDPGLSPNEIETIDVLKDGASTAVYGTRGAAGVILITTKRGQEGRMSVTFDSSYGIQTLGDGIPLMNTAEQIYYETAQFNNGVSVFQPGPFNNVTWLNNDNKFDDYVLVNNAETKRHNLNFTGGTKNFTYNAVVGLFDQDGQLINSRFKRINSRISTTYKSENWTINGSLSFTTEKRARVSGGLINSAIRYKPYYPKVDPDVDVVITNGNGGVTTPLNLLALALKRKDDSNRDRFQGNLSLSRKLGNDVTFTTRLGSSITNDIRNIFIPQYTLFDVTDNTTEVDPTKSSVTANTIRATVLSWDGSLNYKKKFGNHNVGLQATAAIDERIREEFTAMKQGVANNNITVLNGATVNPDVFSGGDFGNGNYTETVVGLLGRFTYDYKGKYLLSALVRRDGSSKFGAANRWGTFPSVSLAWNVSDEAFWSSLKRTVNNFKIRASYGEIGYNGFPNYEYAPVLVQDTDYIFDETDGTVEFGTAIKSYANRDVVWETSISRNIGVDLSFLKNKITLTADYYHTRKEDMLFPVQLPGSGGSFYDRTITLNVGNMTNKGLELAANYRTKIGKSKLTMGATFTKNENKVTKMFGSTLIYNNNAQLVNGHGGSTVIAEGYEVGAYFLYETDGTIQTQEELDAYRQFPSRANARLGDLKYVDYNGDGDITLDDRYYHGSGLPEFEVGYNLRWNYKSWDFSMNWYASIGSDILNGTSAETHVRGRHKNLVNMWTLDNPTSGIPIHADDAQGAFNYRGDTDYWLEDGDYLRLKQVTLGYSLPNDVTEKIGISKLRMYLSAQNALTFTNYNGYDPEIGGNVLARGVDKAKYPLTALYTFGVNLKF